MCLIVCGHKTVVYICVYIDACYHLKAAFKGIYEPYTLIFFIIYCTRVLYMYIIHKLLPVVWSLFHAKNDGKKYLHQNIYI